MEKPIPELITVEAARDTHRWVAMTALLLAIGVILHTISPNVGGVTPNWTIAMYSITISLTRPGLTRALGIGFVAGVLVAVAGDRHMKRVDGLRFHVAEIVRACSGM